MVEAAEKRWVRGFNLIPEPKALTRTSWFSSGIAETRSGNSELQSGCGMLLTEDLDHNQDLDGLRILSLFETGPET
jgi:hypothetical protein